MGRKNLSKKKREVFMKGPLVPGLPFWGGKRRGLDFLFFSGGRKARASPVKKELSCSPLSPSGGRGGGFF